MRHAFTQSDHGTTAALALGDELELRLPENATTGFRWQLDAPDLVQLEDRSERATAGALGAGGQRVFTLRADALGEARVDAKLVRAWEGDASAQSRFSLTVRVT